MKKNVPRKRYVLVAVEAGDDQAAANQMMRDVAAVLPASMRTHMTTVDSLPPVLAKFARVQ